MKPVDWANSSQMQQRELVVQWHKNGQWEIYENMAIEAADHLKKSLVGIPAITGVEIGRGDTLYIDNAIHIPEIVLNVYSIVPKISELPDLPTRFEGFRVRQMNLGEKREAFLKTWKRLFKELKGWDEKETIKWAERWADALDGRRESAVYHYGPIKIALSSLVDEEVKKAAGSHLQKLYAEIADAIGKPRDASSQWIEHPDVVENYDWGYVRKRISELIKKNIKN